MPDQWEQLGDYSVRKAPWTISKSFVDGCSMFVVWKDGEDDPVKFCDEYREARKYVAEQEGRL